ncbi:MAG: sigma 54-interacting transcriptional regulator [Deltaproteobacteria bacterium]|nr:sigma 54-interacting transcriptional regulator [Deltaproteobacteria bacterium]
MMKKSLSVNRRASILPRINNLFNIPINFFELLDEIAIGIVILDLNRKIVVMNQALKALIGFSQKEFFGVSCAHILRSNVCLYDCPMLHINEKSGPKCTEGNLINRDRQLIPISITSAPLKNFNGKLVGFLETVEDISLLRKLDEKSSHAYKFNNIIGRSPEMEKIFQILPSLAQSDSSVLITGETGTGKDMVAETIHQTSSRAKGPFVKINCGALPETLLESELFGHRKGAFTGAVENKPGRIQHANNGTLYLTEIGDLPISLQAKLLTFLDDKEVFPLGSVKGFTANVRIVAATHRNLEQWVNDGRFRKDLLFRLNVIRLHLPPLRSREGDIQLLLDHFLNTLSTHLDKKIQGLSRKTLNILKNYNYPGNVRELKNILEYAVNICGDRHIKPKHLPSYLVDSDPFDVAFTEQQPATLFVAKTDGSRFVRPVPDQNWPDIEKQMIVEALIKAGGRKNKTAVSLGWSRSTLWRKMNQYGIR